MKTMAALALVLGLAALGGCATSAGPDDEDSRRLHSGLYHRDEVRERDVIPYRDDGVYHRDWRDGDRDHGRDDW